MSVLFLLSPTYGQRFERMKAREKMEELKKIKLIEILQMDEETSIKFFSRRAEHMKKVETIHFAEQEKINQLNDLLKNEKERNPSVLQKAIDEYLALQENIIKVRQNFFKTAGEILSVEQMARLLVFEERFRDEISGLLFRERSRKKREDR